MATPSRKAKPASTGTPKKATAAASKPSAASKAAPAKAPPASSVPAPAAAPKAGLAAGQKSEADLASRGPRDWIPGPDSLCQIEILKDGHFFIARTHTEGGGAKEYKNTVFEDMLTEMVISLQEQISD